MKNRTCTLPRWVSLLMASALAGLLGLGCKNVSPRLTEPNGDYLAALQETGEFLPEGSAAESNAIERVISLFSDFQHDPVSAKVRGVYAERLFFRDGFKEFRELEPLAEYMIESTKPLRSCTFTFEDPVRSGKNYYLQWTMSVNLTRDDPERVEQVIGMSHIRFDTDGRVVFQQDYWDPSDVLYRRIPLAGWMIGKVKERL